MKTRILIFCVFALFAIWQGFFKALVAYMLCGIVFFIVTFYIMLLQQNTDATGAKVLRDLRQMRREAGWLLTIFAFGWALFDIAFRWPFFIKQVSEKKQ